MQRLLSVSKSTRIDIQQPTLFEVWLVFDPIYTFMLILKLLKKSYCFIRTMVPFAIHLDKDKLYFNFYKF